VLLCFFVASTFWVLNSLNKTYYNVRTGYPLVFVYNSQKLVPVTQPPKEVVVNVTAKGWKLLRKALNLRIRPARIDLSSPPRRNFLTSRQLRPYINTAFHGVVLNYVVTDTVYFNFEELVKRKIRLTLDSLNPPTAENYMIVGKPLFRPASVTVSGPASLVKSLPDPYPVHLPDSDLTAAFKQRVPLSFVPKELLRPNLRQVQLEFQVKSLREGKVKLPINGHNTKLAHTAAFTPASVLVKYYYDLPAGKAPDSTAFKVKADLSKINPRDSTVQLQVIQKPAQVKRVVLSPEKVKVSLKKP
jgi:hypothetical protein